jgi:lysophospholipase L1-like esterase
MGRAGHAGGRLVSFAKHAALVLFGFAAALLLVELGLRAAGAVVRSVGQRDGAGSAGERVVLCVGDSHTYGAPLPREDAYPVQLEERLAELEPDAHWRVVNRGIPGMNSAQVAALLESWVEIDRPELVVVWVGANNWWNREDPAGLHGNARRPGWRALLEGSRLYRLHQSFTAQATFGDWDAAASDLAERSNRWLHGEPVPARERYVTTVRDLLGIAAILERHGLPWLLVSYPQPEYRWQRAAAEQVAQRAGVPLVDTVDDVERAQRDHPEAELRCPWPAPEGAVCLMVDAMGPHPTRLLYRYVAESIAGAIPAALAASAGEAPRPGSGS